MLCKKPFMAGAVPFGCGQCLPCRINKRRQWMWRQFFESLTHKENCFVTLTYSPENYPVDGSLRPRDLQLWLKRFRKALHPLRVRFFAVGEYGDGTERAHYHASLFGVSGYTFVGNKLVSKIVEETWGLGHVMVAEFNEATAQYVAGYTTKKLTAAGDPKLNGRHPEFMRSSKNPGLGTKAMEVVATQLKAVRDPAQPGQLVEDVPNALKLGRKNIPLGRFLLKKLRKNVGMSDEEIQLVKDKVSYERSVEMSALFKVHDANTFREAHIAEVAQQILNAEARYKLWSKKKGSL